MKHYNAGNVWGRIQGTPAKKKSKEGKGQTYLRIMLNCYNPEFGNVRAYGRLWNKLQIDSLLDHIKKNPGAGLRLRGFFNQYEKDGRMLSNFTWFDWFPDPCERPRAAFVLVGQVMGLGEDTLALELHRDGSGEEHFELHALEKQQLVGIGEGDTVMVKGYLRSREGEDEFGASGTDPIRPYVADITVRTDSGDPAGVPF